MATDVTTLLIQMVEGGGGQANGLAANSTVLSGAADLLSTAADYAQLLGTAAPAAQALAAEIVAEAAVDVGAAAEATAAVASTIATPAVGAVVVLIVTLIATILSALGNSSSSNQSQQLQALRTAVEELEAELATYWNGKLSGSSLDDLWSPVGVALDNLARAGTADSSVVNDVSNYHDYGLAFINLLLQDPFSDQFWQVLAQPAGDVPQSPLGPTTVLSADEAYFWVYNSWYGQFPKRLTVPGSPSGNAFDPVTMAPVLALGIQSYLTLQSLLNIINRTQPTLSQFLSDFGADLADGSAAAGTGSTAYANFLYDQYQLAVNGIVKTDLPTEEEILGSLWWIAQTAFVFAHPSTNPAQPTDQSWGAPLPSNLSTTIAKDPAFTAFSGSGWAWNYSYGASETYPQYGFYGSVQLDPTQRNLFTPAYIVSTLDTSGAVSQWQNAKILFNVWSETYVSIENLQNWAIPWIQNRLILGRMARWKAIYLLNGFDALWSVLQALQRLAAPNPPVVPAIMTLAQDGMIATGNWSARELCNVVVTGGIMLTGNDYVDAADSGFTVTYSAGPLSGQSVGGLIEFLYNIANGNWAGPPEQNPDQGPLRPLSFRGLLAGAAM
jgi:hypothetical protein